MLRWLVLILLTGMDKDFDTCRLVSGFLKLLSLARILGNPICPRSSLRNEKRFLLFLKAAKICNDFLLSCRPRKNFFIRVNSLRSIKFSVYRSVARSKLLAKLSSTSNSNWQNHSSSVKFYIWSKQLCISSFENVVEILSVSQVLNI